jgi:nondiscriminating aspartyl-tRNA synthetase
MLGMKRVLARDVKGSVGKQVQVAGWLHKKRLLGGLTFINVRDRSGLVQVVVEDRDEVEKLRGLQIGTVLRASGTVHDEPRAPGGAELRAPQLEALVPVEEQPAIEIDKPIDHKPENYDTLFENRPLNVRNLQEQKIFRIRSELNRYIREFLHENEFIEIQTPKLLAGATEGGAEVFKLDYFGQEATLAQSPQLYKQIMVGAFERVFEIGPAFRAEPSMTTRHLSEASMLDIEMGFIESHADVLDLIQDMTYAVLTRVNEEHADELKSLNAPELVLKPEFPRFTVAEVHALYTKATKDDTTQEKDLTPAEERWICDYAKKNSGCEAVFVTEFPVEAVKFYHMVNPDNLKTVLWADLLFRGVEIATCPQREHHYEKLVEQMKAAGLDPNHPGYKYYLQAFKNGLPAHGGCGLGIDRLAQKTIGLNSVKEATLFPRDMNRLAP